jgi:hypothetical protein
MGGSITGEPTPSEPLPRATGYTVATTLGKLPEPRELQAPSRTSRFFRSRTQAINLRKLDFGFNVNF